MQHETGTAYFLVHDENLDKCYQEGDPFISWLFSEGFGIHEVYHGVWQSVTTVWINLNTKIIAFGMPGVRCFEEIGHHAITIDEFKVIYAIYKQYEVKAPLVFK